MANREHKPYPKHERVRPTHPERRITRKLKSTSTAAARLRQAFVSNCRETYRVTPTEFKSRFIASLPPIPDDIDLSLDDFAIFPIERIANLRVSEADRRLLAECGLPADAPPFLSFGLTTDRVLMPLDGFPDSVAIGHNGCGDMICIDQSAAGAVVYYNHDNHMQRVFMNASLVQFAECLCLFANFMQTKDADTFIRQLGAVDPSALAIGSFWPNEVQSEHDA